ncbi:hypothetical protein DCO58_05330 [Helicobacter saguini]|uniref:Glycine zipper domain-containing protein n=1 Tax=Helicobacter saguini TaxID=1548018 RepID=A0A347VT58_9HELI|nr:hypothetical protein [Helicobacter saguini]MWV62228.1 hypothetical protein [Helicobacter saguini]MWV67099.1 hypothetical protein [Helicobacter saguini]MWV69449.1 hypothetical protein [Helicobacter saguini]MWV70998.1 hypothetical protein [Helicobacter saguini]TLD92918.1 hypothetical protein LS64_009510 [Helicobacter saguini]
MRLKNESESEYNARKDSNIKEFDRLMDGFMVDSKDKGLAAQIVIPAISVKYANFDFINNTNAIDSKNSQNIESIYFKDSNLGFKTLFDENDNFKYNNKQIEVPLNQGEKYISLLENKLTNINASEIIKTGHFTYDVAKLEAKFGYKIISYNENTSQLNTNLECGISFLMNILICYNNSKDKDIKEAIRQAFIIELKTGSKTFSTNFLSKQKEEKLVESISDSTMQKNIGKLVGKGLGKIIEKKFAKSTLGNSALRGTMITAAATMAVTSGLELMQMARKKISGTQCVINLIKNASEVTGGAAGAVVGALALSFIPVVGTLAGGLLGGMLGGMLGGILGEKATSGLEDDMSKKYRIFYGHMTRLAMLFKLSSDEMQEFSDLVDSIINADSKFFESEDFKVNEMLPYSNSILKPLVVMIVSKRPKLDLESLNSQYINNVVKEEIAELESLESNKKAS